MVNKRAYIILIIVSTTILLTAGILYVLVSLGVFSVNTNNTNTNKITIKFDSNGGTYFEDIIIEKGKSTTLPIVAKDGYNFIGWVLDNKVIDDNYQFSKDVTLTAKWEENTKVMVITFNSNGGSNVNKLTVDCNKTLKLPSNPTKSGYTFVSWADKHGKVILDGAKLTCENITLYANWEKVNEPKKTKTITDVKETYSKEVIEESGSLSCEEGYVLVIDEDTYEGHCEKSN